MADSNFSHCQECGKKLTSAIFCVPCKASFCTQACYHVHKAKHARTSAHRANGNSQPARHPFK